MRDDPFDLSAWPPALPPRFERKTEELGSFRSSAGTDWRVRLLYHGEWGVEGQLLSDAGGVLARRFDTHVAAVAWLDEERKAIE